MKKNWNIWYILCLAIIFYCLDFFFRISPSLVINPLMQQYHVSSTGIGIFATAFYLGYVVMQLPTGIILDRFDIRPIFIIATLLCVTAYINFIQGSNFYIGIGDRFLVGLGSAFSFIGTLYIAKKYLPQKFFSCIAGITIAFGTLAASEIQHISALYLDNSNWHSIFKIIAASGLLIGILLLLSGRVTSKKPHSDKKTGNWLKAFTYKPLIKNAIIGGMFYLPTSIFAGLWGISLLHIEYNLTNPQSSFAIMMLFLGWGIGSPIIGYLSSRIHNNNAIIYLGSIIGFILSVIFLYMPYLVGGTIYLFLFLFGLSSSCQVAIWSIFSQFKIKKLQGTAIAITNMIIMLIAAIFHTIVGLLINHHHNHLFSKTQITYSLNDYHMALLVMPISFLIVLYLQTRTITYKDIYSPSGTNLSREDL